MTNIRIKTEVVKLNSGKYATYIESKLLPSGDFPGSSVSKPFKTFKSEKLALNCKKKLDKISINKKFAWVELAKKPKLKC